MDSSTQAADPRMIFRMFITVSACAVTGMVMGGAFGAASGYLAPTRFTRLIPWENLEPVGTGIVLGAAVGVLLGGGLGVFGILIMLVFHSLKTFRGQGD